jgi:hypothetical protein
MFHRKRYGWLEMICVAACVLGVVAARLRLDGGPVRAQTSGDDRLLQLAERLLSSQIPGAAVNGTPGSVQLYPGALAPDFPAGMPMPPGSALLGSDEYPSFSPTPLLIGNTGVSPLPAPSQSSSAVHVDVVLDAPGSAADAMSFFKTALAGSGWSAASSPLSGGVGFLSSARGSVPTVYCRGSDNAQLSVTARTEDGGQQDLRLAYDTGFNPQCSPPPSTTMQPSFFVPPVPGFGVIPALQPPDGASVSSTGGAVGTASRSGTDAVAATDMAVADLSSFYAGELGDAGWTQLAAGGGAALSWSTWSIPDHSDLQGFLYVRSGPASGQRSLHLEVGSTDPSAILSPSSGVGIDVGAPVSGSTRPGATPPATATATPSPPAGATASH